MANKGLLVRGCESEKQILGKLSVYNEFGHPLKEYDTLELKWLGNASMVSGIPAGDYVLERGKSAKNGLMYSVLRVPERIGIQIHAGNYYTQIQGCILVGVGLKDINKDGFLDVIDSRMAMAQLWDFDIKSLKIVDSCVIR